MNLEEYASFDATDLVRLVCDGEVTAGELQRLAVAGAEAVNPELNAVIEIFEDRRDGIEADALPDGPFRGVPYFIKDLGCAEAGRNRESGSRLAAGFVAREDTETMRRVRAAGLVPMGRTTTPEFGATGTTESILTGATCSPWNTGHSSGGSSGGSSAIIAAGVVPMASGGDGGGSLRIPASACGLVGLKPSRGRVTKAPGGSTLVSPLAIELGMTRSVRDTAALLDALHGPAPGEAFEIAPPYRPYVQEVGAPTRTLRIGMSTEAWGPYAPDPQVVEAVHKTAALLESMGNKVEEASPAISFESYFQTFTDLWCSAKPAMLGAVAAETGRPIDDTTVEPNVLAMYERGLGMTATDLILAFDRVNTITRQMAGFFDTYDLLMTPTIARPPAPLGTVDLNHAGEDTQAIMDRLYSYFCYTPLINLTGQPAISLPLHWTADGLPVGVHFVARFGAEDVLLRLAGALEVAAPWRNRRPPVHIANG